MAFNKFFIKSLCGLPFLCVKKSIEFTFIISSHLFKLIKVPLKNYSFYSLKNIIHFSFTHCQWKIYIVYKI